MGSPALRRADPCPGAGLAAHRRRARTCWSRRRRARARRWPRSCGRSTGWSAPPSTPAGTLPDQTSVVYVSPLKALSNDVRRNLEQPLAEIKALAVEMGYPAPEVRTAVRTGDTTARERRETTRRPPHVLVTTPESLFILLTSRFGAAGPARRPDRGPRRDPRRGAATSAARTWRCRSSGSSISSRAARTGLQRGRPVGRPSRPLTWRPACCVGTRPPDARHRRRRPAAGPGPGRRWCPRTSWAPWPRTSSGPSSTTASPTWRAPHRSTLVFVNTRRLVERVTLHLAERAGEGHRRRAPRQPVARAPPPRRAAAEGGRPEGRRRHGLAGAGDRRRVGRALLPDRLAAVDRDRPAADRALGARAGGHPQGAAVSADA